MIFIVSLVGVVAMMFRFVTHADMLVLVETPIQPNSDCLLWHAERRAAAGRSRRAQANFRTYGQEARTPLRTM
jgi:hypothetical protein